MTIRNFNKSVLKLHISLIKSFARVDMTDCNLRIFFQDEEI